MAFDEYVIDVIRNGASIQQKVNVEKDATIPARVAPARVIQLNGNPLTDDNPLPVKPLVNNDPVLASTAFSNSTLSNVFTIAKNNTLVIIPPIANNPTLTLQVSLNGTIWANTSIIALANATIATVIESDLMERVAGAIGLSNALRFESSIAITATLSIRSIN